MSTKFLARLSKPLAGFAATLILAGLATSQVPRQPWDVGTNTGQAGQETAYLEDPGGGFCGVPVELGDYNNDGFVDYAVCPILADSGPLRTRSNAGEVVVFAGNGNIGGVIDMQNAPIDQPLAIIYGANANDLLGTEIYSADVTGDGIVDLIIGASGADPNGRNLSGAVYIVPGGATFGGVIDLLAPPPGVITFQGIGQFDRMGLWVEAGDVDGDGIADIIISADDGDGPAQAGPTDRGEVYIVYGGQALPPVIDMASPPVGMNFVTVYGVDGSDHLGVSMHSADLDADGFDEIILAAAINRAVAAQTGAAFAGADGPGNARNNCGETYVIWGQAGLPTVIDLSNVPTGVDVTTVIGADAGDVLGEELTSGDIDGDGFIDLVLGALTADGMNNSIPNAGDTVVVYGGPQLRNTTVDTQNTPAGTTTIYGEDISDILGDTLSCNDVNADGFDDLVIALPSADPNKPGIGVVNGAGEVIVLYGGPVRLPTTLTSNALTADYPHRRVWGEDAGDLCGYSMECGDFDSDGFADVFPNAMRGDGAGNTAPDAGEIHIVSGQRFSRGIATLGTEPKINSTIEFNMVGEPNETYFAAFSGAANPAQVAAGQVLFLANDFLFQLSLTSNLPFFVNLSGTLDANGQGQYGLFIPNLPSVAGLPLFTAFGTFNAMSGTILTIGASTRFTLEL